MNFLETITFLGDNILVPINRIRYIYIRHIKGWEIHIIGDNDIDLSEHFGEDNQKLNKRYEEIKKIIKAK